MDEGLNLLNLKKLLTKLYVYKGIIWLVVVPA